MRREERKRERGEEKEKEKGREGIRDRERERGGYSPLWVSGFAGYRTSNSSGTKRHPSLLRLRVTLSLRVTYPAPGGVKSECEE